MKREQQHRLTAPAKKHRNALPRSRSALSRSALSGSLIGYHIPTARTTRPFAHRHPSFQFGHLGTCLFCPFFGHFKHVPNCPKSQDISLSFVSTLFLSILCHRVRRFLKNPTDYLYFLPIKSEEFIIIIPCFFKFSHISLSSYSSAKSSSVSYLNIINFIFGYFFFNILKLSVNI